MKENIIKAFVWLGLFQLSPARPAFTHTKEGSYGNGEHIQFFGQFFPDDIQMFERGDFFVSVFDTGQIENTMSNRIPLQCTLSTVDTFENGFNRPLTQQQYFQHYLDCEASYGGMVHEQTYGLVLEYYDTSFEFHEDIYGHVTFLVSK